MPIPSGVNLETSAKIQVTVIQFPPIEMPFLLRFSNLLNLLRIIARLRRVVQPYRKEATNATPEYVTIAELQQAKQVWVKYIQSLYFAKEISD